MPTTNINLTINKTTVGLSNVDNTSDVNKPVSTAQQTALNLKEDSANKDIDGTLAANSDIKFPSQKAIKTYVDAAVASGTIADASPTIKGKAKLYSDVTSNNTDGAPDQNSVNVALATKEATTNKDATGGYAGLTLFKINFKNALNTFTSFFTNSNTTARTYTFQDRNGTIADDTDLALKAPLASPSLTGTPTAPTAAIGTNTTQIANTAYVQNEIEYMIINSLLNTYINS